MTVTEPPPDNGVDVGAILDAPATARFQWRSNHPGTVDYEPDREDRPGPHPRRVGGDEPNRINCAKPGDHG